MPVVERTITVTPPPMAVWAFLADFTTTEEWDPPTVSTQRLSGDGGVGTTYRNVVKFQGRRTEVDYVVVDYVEGRRLCLRGSARGLQVIDTFTVEPTSGGGSQVTYEAQFIPVIPRLGSTPFALPSMRQHGDFVAESLQESLEHLSA